MKEQNGITLIALVITIIVLLILSGVSINVLSGENGVVNKVKIAVERHKEEKAKEEVTFAWGSCQSEYDTEKSKIVMQIGMIFLL